MEDLKDMSGSWLLAGTRIIQDGNLSTLEPSTMLGEEGRRRFLTRRTGLRRREMLQRMKWPLQALLPRGRNVLKLLTHKLSGVGSRQDTTLLTVPVWREGVVVRQRPAQQMSSRSNSQKVCPAKRKGILHSLPRL